MNAIVQRQSTKPAPISHEIDGLVRKLSSRIQDVPGAFRTYTVPETCAPSPAERGAIEVRRQHVTGGLVPIGAEPDEDTTLRIKRAIVALKTAFPKSATDDASAKAVVSLYISALRTYPEWAITEACRRFLDGRAGKGSYAPTPPELARECASLVTPLYEERAALDRILLANTYREVPAEERDRVTAEFNRFAREIRYSNDMDKPGKERRKNEREFRSGKEAEIAADAELARLEAAAGHYKPLASPALSAKLKEQAA